MTPAERAIHRVLTVALALLLATATPTSAQLSLLGDEVTWGDARSWVLHGGAGATATVSALPLTDDPWTAAHVSAALSLGYQLGQWSIRREWRTVDSTMDVVGGVIGAYLTAYLMERWARRRDP